MADFAERTSLLRGGLSLADLRRDYRLAEFDEQNCQTNPFEQFGKWFREAQAADLIEPNAMALATVGARGRPSNRIVLLKELDEIGFVFYTSYISRKGRELEANPYCALAFYWAELERQVRIEGKAEKVSRSKTEEYFRRRPRGSRLGALTSFQSAVIPGRQILEERLEQFEHEYEGTDEIPVPEYWGGYRVVPDTIE